MSQLRTLLLFVALGSVLAGCGARRELLPAQGRSLPEAPYGRGDQPNADALLTPPVQAKPERSVELRSRSQDRDDDPFDLPPED